MLDRSNRKHAILTEALKIAAFEGWNDVTLTKASVAAGEHYMAGVRLFDDSINELLVFFNQTINEELSAQFQAEDIIKMRTSERVAWLLCKRFELLAQNKEAVRRMIARNFLPSNSAFGMQQLWQNCDIIWRLAGDKSLDFNYYTKRSLLAKVYLRTMFFWLDCEDASELKDFVDNQIAGVLRAGQHIGKTKTKISNMFEYAADRALNPKRYRTKKF
jgi:ubiquinone biosynthesis protein COQ9